MRRKANAVKDLAESSIALTIAGFDPSSGAGVTADLQVFAAHGVHGVSAITALTVQSTREVRRVEPVNGELLRESLECLAGDLRIGGVKIGMLGTAEAVGVVAMTKSVMRVQPEPELVLPVLAPRVAAAGLLAQRWWLEQGVALEERGVVPVSRELQRGARAVSRRQRDPD